MNQAATIQNKKKKKKRKEEESLSVWKLCSKLSMNTPRLTPSELCDTLAYLLLLLYVTFGLHKVPPEPATRITLITMELQKSWSFSKRLEKPTQKKLKIGNNFFFFFWEDLTNL